MTLSEYTGFSVKEYDGFIRKQWTKPNAVRLWLKYREFRTAGYRAAESLRSARTVIEWREFEWDDFSEPVLGECRLRAEPEDESYFDVYGEPDGYTNIHGKRISAEAARAEIVDCLDRLGAWWIVAEFWNGEDWEQPKFGSIGMCTGYENVLDAICNSYVGELMASAIEAAKDAIADDEAAEIAQDAFDANVRKWGDWRLDLLADSLA